MDSATAAYLNLITTSEGSEDATSWVKQVCTAHQECFRYLSSATTTWCFENLKVCLDSDLFSFDEKLEVLSYLKENNSELLAHMFENVIDLTLSRCLSTKEVATLRRK